MIRYLLDTHIVTHVLKQRPAEVLHTFNQSSGRMAISSITPAELFHSAEKSSRITDNLKVIEDFTSRLAVLTYTPKAAQHYGSIRAGLENKGEPTGMNNLHVAAHDRRTLRH